MFSGFQGTSFQTNAYQINIGSNVVQPWTGGGPKDGDYYERIKRYREDQERLAYELKEAEKRLEKENPERNKALEQERLDQNKILSVKQNEIDRLQELAHILEISRLQGIIEELKAKLWRSRIEEEDILILLMTIPFKN